MSSFTKTKLKALKESVAKKDWKTTERNANDVLTFEGSNYNARVFLALAQFHLESYEPAEENYKKAVELSPSTLLARQGLASFYEKRGRWEECARELGGILGVAEESGDAPKFAESLQKLVDVRKVHGTSQEQIGTLSLLLPSSRAMAFLRAKLPSSHPLYNQLMSPLKAMLELIKLIEPMERSAIDKEISKRRTRLGGPALGAEETRRLVERDFMRSSQLPNLYEDVLADADAGSREDLRRETEHKLLRYLVRLTEILNPDETDYKNGVRARVEDLARGMRIVKVADQLAWDITLEWRDDLMRDVSEDALTRELADYAELFPESGLAELAIALPKYWRRRRLLAEQERRDLAQQKEEEEPEPDVATADTLTDTLDADATSEIIERSLTKATDSLLAHYLAARFYYEESDWDACSQVCDVALSILTRLERGTGRTFPNAQFILHSYLAVALTYHESPAHHLRALRLLDSCLQEAASTRLLICKALTQQHAERWEAAVETWSSIANETDEDERAYVLGEKCWCLFQVGRKDEAREGFLEVVRLYEARRERREDEMRRRERKRSKQGRERTEGVEEGERTSEKEERARAWWRLGQCAEQGSTDAQDAFSASIKAASDFAPAYTALGLWFREVDDYERASLSFQKAFELDAAEEVAARCLAEEFALLGEWALVDVIARRVVGSHHGRGVLGGKLAKRLAWAWKAIGGAELGMTRWEQAIFAFQNALRGEPTDVHTWIRLGVAYRRSGKHVASLKVFHRALSLDQASWYAKFCIGDVQRELGLFEPAVEVFREILSSRPDELGVRVVLAETLLALGDEQLHRGFVARARDSLWSALDAARALIEDNQAVRVAWKVVASTLSSLSNVPLEQTPAVVTKLLEHCKVAKVDTRMDAVESATVAAAMEATAPAAALRLASISALKMRVVLETADEAAIGTAWYDLGSALFEARHTLSDKAPQEAIKCLKYALHHEPVNADFWNALGVLAFDISARLAQHAFIRAIEFNSRTPIPWTNLGLFYIAHDEHELANEALLRAQTVDPDWAAAWVGQSLLAQAAGHAPQATSLLEHASSLGSGPGGLTVTSEADLAYASAAYRQGGELGGPLSALVRYLSLRPDDVDAQHLAALVLERTGDRESASQSLERAASMLEASYEESESPELERKYAIAQTNLGRVRLARGDAEGALEAFEAPISLMSAEGADEETLALIAQCRLGTALACAALNDNEAAVEAIEAGLEDLAEPAETSDVVFKQREALAIALHKVHWTTGEEDFAKSALLDSMDRRRSSNELYSVMLAHAAVSHDMMMVKNILAGSMRQRASRDPNSTEVIATVARVKLAQSDVDGALAALQSACHTLPWRLEHKLALATLLLQQDAAGNAALVQRLMPRLEGNAGTVDEQTKLQLVLAEVARAQENAEEHQARLERATWLTPWNDQVRATFASLPS